MVAFFVLSVLPYFALLLFLTFCLPVCASLIGPYSVGPGAGCIAGLRMDGFCSQCSHSSRTLRETGRGAGLLGFLGRLCPVGPLPCGALTPTREISSSD